MTEALINKGIAIVGNENGNNVGNKSRIVVVGTARGGTSLVAGAMSKLGIFMGERCHHPVYEDVRLSECFETKNLTLARQVAQEYSDNHPIWGWKRPSSIDYLDVVHETLDSPAYIFIYKDIFSIAQRNAISMLSQIVPNMQRSIKEYQATIDFLDKVKPTALLVSYDKAVSWPENFVDSVIEFCNINPTEKQKQAAISFIDPDPKDYLDVSRITKANGSLDAVRGRVIHGWAKYAYNNEVATVNLFLNDQLIATIKADQSRPDLIKTFNQKCAFVFTIPDSILVANGDLIRARVTDEVTDIKNSPLPILTTIR